jgi:hypothetical protein
MYIVIDIVRSVADDGSRNDEGAELEEILNKNRSYL